MPRDRVIPGSDMSVRFDLWITKVILQWLDNLFVQLPRESLPRVESVHPPLNKRPTDLSIYVNTRSVAIEGYPVPRDRVIPGSDMSVRFDLWITKVILQWLDNLFVQLPRESLPRVGSVHWPP